MGLTPSMGASEPGQNCMCVRRALGKRRHICPDAEHAEQPRPHTMMPLRWRHAAAVTQSGSPSHHLAFSFALWLLRLHVRACALMMTNTAAPRSARPGGSPEAGVVQRVVEVVGDDAVALGKEPRHQRVVVDEGLGREGGHQPRAHALRGSGGAGSGRARNATLAAALRASGRSERTGQAARGEQLGCLKRARATRVRRPWPPAAGCWARRSAPGSPSGSRRTTPE